MGGDKMQIAQYSRFTPLGCMLFYIKSSGLIFLLTGLAKIVSALGNERILDVVDPIIGIQFRWLFLICGAVELIVAGICFFCGKHNASLLVLLSLSLGILQYRFGLWWIGYQKPCRCLGGLTDMLHIPGGIADLAMKLILAYVLIGAAFFGLNNWLKSNE